MYGFVYFTRMVINTKLFVVEERVATRKKDDSIKLKRDAIPLFRVIDIKTLRIKYIKREDNGEVNHLKVGHERRRHERTLRSSYFKNRQGETIIINACWVGPAEVYDPDKHRLFKVRLDIG